MEQGQIKSFLPIFRRKSYFRRVYPSDLEYWTVRGFKISNTTHVDAKTPPWFNSHQAILRYSPLCNPFRSPSPMRTFQPCAETSYDMSSCTLLATIVPFLHWPREFSSRTRRISHFFVLSSCYFVELLTCLRRGRNNLIKQRSGSPWIFHRNFWKNLHTSS